MEKDILSLLTRNPNSTWTSRDISKQLHISKDGRQSLRYLLKRMAHEGKIIRHRGSRYASISLQETVEGKLKVRFEGYGFVLSEDPKKPDVFIPARHMGPALPGDRVLASSMEQPGSKRREGRILRVLERGREVWTGILEKPSREFWVVNREYSFDIPILVNPKQLKGARLGQMVAVRLNQSLPEEGFLSGDVIEILGEPRDESVIVNSILTKHGIIRDFPSAVIKFGCDIKDHAKPILGKRIDLRAKPLMTIDGIYARDFDDAVCVEETKQGFLLTVCIADVAHYVTPHTVLDYEALRRGTSVYLPKEAIPMLPEVLSNDLCSLTPGEDKLTLTCEVSFDTEGRWQKARFFESVMHSHKRGEYTEVQNYFDKVAGSRYPYPPEVQKSLHAMKKLSEKLMKQKVRRGALDFDLPESSFFFNEKGEISAIGRSERHFSHRLIEEFMIVANRAVAEVLGALNAPIPYRVHDKPDPHKLEDFMKWLRLLQIPLPKGKPDTPLFWAKVLDSVKGHPLESVFHSFFLRSLKQAVYQTENRGHFGLALEDYCHFTSPIRRYPDLIVHRQLKGLLAQSSKGILTYEFEKRLASGMKRGAKKHFPHSKAEVDRMSLQSSQRERGSMETEREVMDLVRALFMEPHVGKYFMGLVKRIAKFGVFIELRPHFVDGLLLLSELKDDYYEYNPDHMELVGRKTHRKIRIGDEIEVLVKDVSLQERQVLLALREKRKKGK